MLSPAHQPTWSLSTTIKASDVHSWNQRALCTWLAPRWPQDGPKTAQDGPRWPKMAQDGLKMAQVGPSYVETLHVVPMIELVDVRRRCVRGAADQQDIHKTDKFAADSLMSNFDIKIYHFFMNVLANL